MIWVFLILAGICAWLSIAFFGDDDWKAILSFVVGFACALVFVIMVVVCCVTLPGGMCITDQISMYEQQNAAIEKEVAEAVSSYQEYEQTTFKNATDTSLIALITRFPQIKSDALVAKQIDVYIANKDQITTLKLRLINLKLYRWWLYFGS